MKRESGSSRSASDLILEQEALLDDPSPKKRLDALNDIAAKLGSSDAARALDYASQALELARELEDAHGEASALQCLAYAKWTSGAYDDAVLDADEALRRFKALGDSKAMARTQLLRSSIFVRQSRINEAMDAVLIAHQLADSIDDRQGAAIALNTLGVLCTQQGQVEKSLGYRLQSAEILQEIGDQYRLGIAYTNIGGIYHEMSDLDRALEYLERARSILEQIEPNGYPVAAVYLSLGALFHARRNLEQALSAYQRALTLQRTIGDTYGVVRSCVALGNLSIDQGNLDSATEFLSEARDTSRECNIPQQELEACLGLTRVNETKGEFEDALRWNRKALKLQETVLKEQELRESEDREARFNTERKACEAEIYQLKHVQLEKETARRRQAERAMQQSQKLESLGIMAGGAAHDFNNMLQCVLGYTALSMEMLEEDDPLKKNLRLAHEAGQRAADLAKQMLAYAGHSQYSMTPCNLNLILQENNELLSGAVGPQTSLHFSLKPNQQLINADAAQIQQILTNLVLNAAEAQATRIEIATISWSLGAEDSQFWEHTTDRLAPGPYILLSVKDNGSGIEEQDLVRIFDPFYTTKFAGRGLGLAAVLGIVRAHGAGIAVGGGATGAHFEIVFPIAAIHETGEPPPAVKSQEEPVISQGNQGTVLVVDDEPSVRMLAAHVLEDAGFNVLTAEDGGAAVELYGKQSQQVDIVLLDITMPGLTGAQTWKRIREINPNAKIVMTSGYDEHRALRELPLGVPFLAKPHQPSDLVQFIAEQIDLDEVDGQNQR